VLLNQHGAERLVDELIISAEVGTAKPHPEIDVIVLERLGVERQEAIFVDDDAGNVAAASTVGLQSLLYTSTPQAIAAVRELS
jgi:putative hydrolase of the HAD superfamily